MVFSSSERGGMLIMLYAQVYDSKRSKRKYMPPGGQLHCSCTGGQVQTIRVEARPTDCELPSLGSGLQTNNKPLLQANEVIFVLYCVTLQGVQCLASATSDYFDSLPAQTRERHLEKLRALAWKTCV